MVENYSLRLSQVETDGTPIVRLDFLLNGECKFGVDVKADKDGALPLGAWAGVLEGLAFAARSRGAKTTNG